MARPVEIFTLRIANLFLAISTKISNDKSLIHYDYVSDDRP